MSRNQGSGWHGGFSAGSIGPAGVNGPKAWWDASVLSLADNAEITQLDDLSGSGNHAVKRTETNPAAAGPTCKTAIQNGLRIARFDSTKRNLGAVFGIAANPITAFMVIAQKNAAVFDTRRNICGFANLGSFNFNTNRLTASDRFELQGTFSGNCDCLVTAINTFHVITIKVPGGSGANGGIWFDGVSQAAAAPFVDNTADVGGTAVGGAPTSTNQSVFDLGEFLIYPKFLNTTDQQAIEAYLKAKWATP